MGIARHACVGVIVSVILPLLAGGCAPGEPAVTLKGPAEFQAVLAGQDPALVMFYKDGCETCEEMQPMIDSLAAEYQGRAVVARLAVVNVVRRTLWPEIKAKYGIDMVPTVILFAGGQEKQRWVAEFDKGQYKKALNMYVRPATQPARAGPLRAQRAGGPPTG